MTAPDDILSRATRLHGVERVTGIGRVVLEVASVDSTNRRLVQLGRAGADHGTVLLTSDQTAGRGKGERSWFSHPDGSLCLSVLVRTGRSLAEAPQLTLLTAVALRQAIAEVCGVNAGIKWPNDLLVGGRKICGILAEAATDADGDIDFAVVGLGLNLSIEQTAFPEELRGRAVSLEELTDRPVDRLALLSAFLSDFDRWLHAWEERGLAAFAATWTRHALDLGRVVRLSDGDEDLCATLLGLADDGALRIQDARGDIRDVHSGEIATDPSVGNVASQFSKSHMGTLS